MIGTDSLLLKSDQLQRLLVKLLDRTMGVKPVPAILWHAKQPGAVASYIHDDKSLGHLWICDLASAGACSAALTLIPVSGVAAAIKQSKLTQDMNDNLREILNVGTALQNRPGSSHHRLNEMYPPPGPLPEAVAKWLTKPPHRLHLDVNVAAYGGGKMSLLRL